MEMSVADHNGQVVTGLESIAKGLTIFDDKIARTQETHDAVIMLKAKMDNVEKFMERITKQLDELPTKLDECYARKVDSIKREEAIALVEERAANRQEVADIKKKVDWFFYGLAGLAITIIVTGAFVALNIADKVHP